MSYSIKWEPQGIHVILEGAISGSDITSPKAKFHQDSRFESLKYSIWDFSAVTASNVSMEDVMTLVALDLGASFTLPFHKLAIVTQDAEITRLAEAFIRQSKESESPWKFRVLASLEAAREWIQSNAASGKS